MNVDQRKLHEIYMQNERIIQLLGGTDISENWVSAIRFKKKFNLTQKQLELRRIAHSHICKDVTMGNRKTYLYSIIEYSKILNG